MDNMQSSQFDLPDSLRKLSDEEWLTLLYESIDRRQIDGTLFPGFPSSEIQNRFVGSSYRETLKEAFKFYRFLKSQAGRLGKSTKNDSRFLDFGCGWGRFLRFFWKDFWVKNLFGCDVLPEAVEACLSTGVPGNIDLIKVDGLLPYPDTYFDFMMAYSVFTHLPEKPHLYWMKELYRVSRPGCLFFLTLEPERFIDDLKNIPSDSSSPWHQSLLKYAHLTDDFHNKFQANEIAYLPTGGGDGLDTDVYGDAIVPLSYIKKHWSPFFVVREYIDDPAQFWQAILVVERL
jgi:ubiquinone/menaquinone biosynthesis C-methylase UbiE